MTRYKRIEELGWDLKILKRSKALVVGAGALGNEVLKNLALLGFGNLILIDMDTIENHNLTRSILFREHNIGEYKSDAAAKTVREIDSSVNIRSFRGTVQETIGLGVFKDVDIVFGCLDNIQARIDLSRSCMQTDTVYIDGGLKGINGDIKVFGNGFEVCFDCILNEKVRQNAWKRFSCLKLKTKENSEPTGPTAPTISSIIAALQVQTAIKFLHGQKINFNTRTSVFGTIDEFGQFLMSRNKNCPTHSQVTKIDKSKIVEIDAKSDDIKLKDFLILVKNDMGDQASIDLGHDIVVSANCLKHEYSIDLFSRRGNIYKNEIECPHCLKEGLTGNSVIMRQNFINQISGHEVFLEKTLSEMKMPNYNIYKAVSYNNGRYKEKYYLINGDKYLFFSDK